MKKYRWSLLFSLIAFSITIACSIVQFRELSSSELSLLIGGLTAGMRTRQIVCVLLLFSLGIIFLYNVNESFDTIWLLLLSYPMGELIWIGVSMILLLVGIPYSLFSMMVAIGLLEVFFVIRHKKRKNHCSYNKEILIHGAIIGIGIVSIVSTGIQFTFSSFDTRYFIELLGKSFVIEGKLLGDFKTYILNTSMGVATLSSLSYMLDVDSIYIIHQILVTNFFMIFYYSLYLKLKKKSYGKKAIAITLVNTLFLFFLPQIQLVGGWVISNSYIMVYLFIAILLLDQIKDSREIPADYKIVLAVIFFVFTYLRSDSSIAACCVFGAVAISKLRNKDVLCYCILPSFLSFVLLFTKIWLITMGRIDGYLGSWSTLGAIFLLYLGVILYYFARGHIFLIIQNKFEYYVLAAPLFILAGLFLYSPTLCLDSIKILLYNFTELSQSGGFWAVTVPFLIMLWWMSHQVFKGKMQILELTALLFILVTIDLVIVRGCVGLSVRRGLGDSFNREFISYVPLTVYAILDRMFQIRKT